MFYTKSRLGSSMTILTEITDANVFSRCPECGAEVLTDLTELLGNGDCDLLSTSVYCDNCAKERTKGSSGFDAPVTLEALAWLVSILRSAGYSDIIDELLYDYDADSINDLPPERYSAFGYDLSDMVRQNKES